MRKLLLLAALVIGIPLLNAGDSLLDLFSNSVAAGKPPIPEYERSVFKYDSSKHSTKVNVGYYTSTECETEADHVVSLKDAWESGAYKWRFGTQLEYFANSPINLVPACRSINRSKGASKPKDFQRKSNDSKGLEYRINNWCDYLDRYYFVKTIFGLDTKENDTSLYYQCFGTDKYKLDLALIERNIEDKSAYLMVSLDQSNEDLTAKKLEVANQHLNDADTDKLNTSAHLSCERLLESGYSKALIYKYWECFYDAREEEKPAKFYFNQ